MAWFLNFMSWGEFTRLATCLFLDIIEYIVPSLLHPIIGDILDICGLATCVYLFKWIGLFAALELVPGADALPINTFLWIIWFISKRQKDIIDKMTEK